MRQPDPFRALALALPLLLAGGLTLPPAAPAQTGVSLPEPARTGKVSVERALDQRRSLRSFGASPLSLADLGQLLWAAQGTTGDGHRTTPSAGARYPLTVFVVAGEVLELPPGVYRYRPAAHRLVRVAAGGRREALARAALDQPWVAAAPAVLVLTARYERTTSKYGERGRRYVHLEAGHAAQNVYLQAEARGLATVMVGAFRDPAVAEVLALEAERTLLALLPVGWPP